MGCDIHLVTEVKVGGTWYAWGQPNVDRNYRLFAKMAGVRSYDDSIKPIAEPRGLPKDCSVMTKVWAAHWGEDGHSHSYLTAPEILELEEWWNELYKDRGYPQAWPEKQWGYFFSNSWGGFTRYPGERPQEIQDVRFVFWFDN